MSNNFWDIVAVIILTSPIWFTAAVFIIFWPRNQWPFKPQDEPLPIEVGQDRKEGSDPH